MTFWQGLVVAIIVNFHSGGRWSETNGKSTTTPREQAIALQNVLICVEMLFFSIAHWCVFTTDEWEEGYAPREYAKPGIGLKDFVSDMKLIAKTSKASRRSKQHGANVVLVVDDELANEDDLTLEEGGDAIAVAMDKLVD